MRKTLRLLTVLLALALVFGMTATAVFANSAATSSDTTPGAIRLSAESSDYQNANFSIYGPTSSNTGTGNTGEAAFANRAGGATVATNGLNKYLNIYHENHNLSSSFGTSGSAGYYGFQFGGYAAKNDFAYGIINYDFITMDMEISSDSYLDENKLLTDEDTGTLAYIPMALTFMARYYKEGASSPTQALNSSYSKLSIMREGNDWYIQDPSAAYKYKLPSVAGEWTHMSVVVEIDNSVDYSDGTKGDYDPTRLADIASFNFTNSKIHIYFNGEYFMTMADSIWNAPVDNPATYINNTTGFASIGGLGFDQLRFQPIYYNETKGVDGVTSSDFSMGVDNLAVHYYYNGYNGDLKAHMADPTQPIYLCDDVVYTGSYQVPAPNQPKAQITDADGWTTNYYIAKGAIDSLNPGDSIELFDDVTTPYTASFPFMIKHNGHSVALDPTGDYIVCDSSVEGMYSVRRALTADYGDVIWDYKGELYEISRCLGGQVPVYPKDEPAPTTVDGVFRIFLGWSTEKGASAPSEIPTVDACGELFLYPVYSNLVLSYAVYTPTGDMYTPNNGLNEYSNPNTFVTVVKAAPSGSRVVLYSDISISSTIDVNKGKSLEIDVNGYTLSKYETSYQTMFTMKEGSSISIYSSRPGGEIVKIAHYGGNTRGYAIVKADNCNCTVNFGDGTQNLTVNAPIIFDAISGSYAGSSDSGHVAKLSINGGTYIRNHSDTSGLIIIRDNVELDIKNANLYAQYGSIIAGDARYMSKVTGTIDNSVLQSDRNGKDDGLIGQFLEGSVLTITNTDLAGLITFPKGQNTTYSDWNASKGTIIFGEGTRYKSNITVNGENIVIDGTASAEPVNGTISYQFYSFDPDFNYTVKNFSCEYSYIVVEKTVVEEPAEPVVEEAPEAIVNIDRAESVVKAEEVVGFESAKVESVTVESGLTEVKVVTSAPTVETVDVVDTREIILACIRSFLDLKALPVSKNSLFII